MLVRLHSQATTTPKIRAANQACEDPAWMLSERYGISVQTVLKWRPSLSAAQLALKYDLPMIPAYGIRTEDGNTFNVDFEAPLPHTDSITMTRAFIDSLSARIMADPEE
jgi:hypothetical protein